MDRQGDVYVASGGDEPGVWEVENVLEATSLAGEFEPQTLSVEVEDVPGVLNQVCLYLCLQNMRRLHPNPSNPSPAYQSSFGHGA